jgi:hypothetical protein
MSQVAENLPQYLSAGIKHSQEIPDGSTWALKIISMNKIVNHNDMTYDIDPGIIRLEGGKAYRITAQLGITGEVKRTRPGVFLAFGLFATDGKQIGPLAEALQIGLNSSNASGGVLDVIHAPANTGDYCLKMAPNVKADSSIRLSPVGTFFNVVEIMPGTDVLSLRRVKNQTIPSGTTWAGQKIIMTPKMSNGSIAYDNNTGEFTLKGRKTYRITAQLGWKASSNGWYAFGLFDSKGTQIGPVAEALSPNVYTCNASGGVLDVIHTPYATGKFHLRMSSGVTAGSSSSIRADVSTYMNIVSIPEQKSYVSARLFFDQPLRFFNEYQREMLNIINMQIQEKRGTIRNSSNYGTFRIEANKTYRITMQVGIKAKLPGYYEFCATTSNTDDPGKTEALSSTVPPSFQYYTTVPCAIHDIIVTPLQFGDTYSCLMYPFYPKPYDAPTPDDINRQSFIRADTSTFLNIVEI